MSDDHQEIELKLTVLEPTVLDETFGWRELAGFSLQPAMPRYLHDRYWDTAAGWLARSGLNLRVRQVDGLDLFTLKGAATVRDGLFSRRELELPANQAGWASIRAELEAQGVPLPDFEAGGSDPNDWLRRSGFDLVQYRETFRRRVIAFDEQRPIAELALDTTTFHLPAIDVTIREIEIESLTDHSEAVMSLGDALRQQLAGRVEPSATGKYATGLAFKARLEGFRPGAGFPESP